jgi:hypothetical protein
LPCKSAGWWFGEWMLRLVGPQAECLFDVGLPVEVRELPADLAALDVLVDDATLFAPICEAWSVSARGAGRPSIAMVAMCG